MTNPRQSWLPTLLQRLDALDREASARLVLPTSKSAGRHWLVRLGAHSGDSWLWAALLGWLVYDARRRGHPGSSQLCGALLSFLLQIAVTLGLKQLIRRPRPATGHLLYGPGPDQYSFPSGHAMRMAVVAGWAGSSRAGSAPLLGLLGGVVGWCRVRLGIHTIGDVLVGWLLGAMIVGGVRWAMTQGSSRGRQN